MLFRSGRATWLLWVISHPELVEDDEPGDYDAALTGLNDLSAKLDAYDQAKSELDEKRKAEFDGEWAPVKAKVAEAEERAALWPIMVAEFHMFNRYQVRARDRQIPLVILERVPQPER